MFTGIIECTGHVESVEVIGQNRQFMISSPISNELKIDQSVAHEGICLTVEAVENGMHRVTAIDETIQKTNISHWYAGTSVNLERCMILGSRLDGHIVQGHVDATGTCTDKTTQKGSWKYTFNFAPEFAPLIVEKGSICVNGTSLTAFNVTANSFSVAIIPYTYEHTTIGQVMTGKRVNLEFDILGKYILRQRTIPQIA
jgi:riboflavin synthase